MTLSPSYIIGRRHVVFTTTEGISRIITDFDSDGKIDVLTVVTSKGAWRLFQNGTTQGDKPDMVAVSEDSWTPESPTRPDAPFSIPPKKD